MKQWRVGIFLLLSSSLFLLPSYTVSESINFHWAFQSPSHILEVNTPDLSTYTCDPNASDCKINFDFRASVPTDEPSTHYSCLIDFGFGVTGEEEKCNPNTVDFPLGNSIVHLIVRKITDQSIVSEGNLTIVRSDGSIDPLHVTYTKAWQSPTYLLSKEDTSLIEYSCDPNETECKINPQIVPLLDGASSSRLTCEITADFDLIPTTDPCNPNTSLVPSGDHTMIIKIIDKTKNTIVQSSSITFKNSPKEVSIDLSRVSIDMSWQSPTYLLSKENTTLSEYTCDSEQSECKINLLITPKLDNTTSSQVTCDITADFTLIATSDPCNPNTSVVPVGTHTMSIKIRDKAKNSLIKTYDIVLKNPSRDTSIDPTRVTRDIVWQQPTYLLEKDIPKTEYVCDPDKAECSVNLLVTPKLDGLESPKLICHITSDFGIEENDCNPNTFTVPSGNHALSIEILDVQTHTILSTQTIILHGGLSEYSTGGGSGSTSLDLSTVSILVQSGLDEFYTCKTSSCQVNFLAQVPDTALCIWDFGGGSFETVGTNKNCNPGYVRFSQNALIKLTVSDPKTGNSVTRTLQLKYTKDDTKIGGELKAKIDLQTKLSKTKQLTSSGIMCFLGRAKQCNLNFTGENSTGAKIWYWDFGDGTTSDRENPGSHSFKVGEYTVRLVVSDEHASQTVLYQVKVASDLPEKEKCMTCQHLLGKVQFSAVLPNPPHTDTVEWIELHNISHENLELDGCQIENEHGSFDLSGTLGSEKTLRLRQAFTGLNLGNKHDNLTLICGDMLIDTFSWDFSLPTNYILRREVLYPMPVQALISYVVDGDTVDAIIDGKKTRIRLLGIDTPETVHPRKPVEKFGKEASNFTRKTLEGKNVWLTFDNEPIDHYGRRLAYIWQCPGTFSASSCILFNATVVSQGYGRMERRFEFQLYDEFDVFEKEAKDAKIGIWSDPEVTKEMNMLSSTEKGLLADEQEKEYLKLQEELLKKCESEGDCEQKKLEWSEITEKMTTLNASLKKSGMVAISGRSWADLPIEMALYINNKIIDTFSLTTNEVGEYETQWIPREKGTYKIILSIRHDDEVLNKEKEIVVDTLSTHFNEPLESHIVLQGQMTANRRQEDDVFYCYSRGSCSVNVTAESNREDDVLYWWILPDGTFSDEKNPGSVKLEYGQYDTVLIVTDVVTGEVETNTLSVDHEAIGKKLKKSPSTKYTLDLKDVPQDKGGGVIRGEKNPLNSLGINIILLVFLGGITFYMVYKGKLYTYLKK